MNGRAEIEIGSRILLADGIGRVTVVDADGVSVLGLDGRVEKLTWTAVRPTDRAAGIQIGLQPWWDSLTKDVRSEAIERLEIVQLVMTGYREGHEALARPGEPEWPFGPYGESLRIRSEHAARILHEQKAADPTIARRVAYGDLTDVPGSASTIRRWVAKWRREGIRGLVDSRRTRKTADADRVNPEYRRVAEELMAAFTGGKSAISAVELDKRIRLQLARSGFHPVETPQRATGRFLSELIARSGRTPRAQHSNHLRHIAGHNEYPAIRPGQIVAIDATRCDNLVFDEYDQKPRSVEILTAIDVATRVVLACRVWPMSCNSMDLRYLLYDVLREFHMHVDGTSLADWRWAGIPEVLDCTDTTLTIPGPGRGRQRVAGRPLIGCHIIPSVLPDGLRVDRGSINLSESTRLVLAELGIDLLPNRGGKSNDNAHIERWWETLQAALQALPGYKGRTTSQRGTLVADEPLLTVADLQRHLHWWIGTTYHRREHDGLLVPGDPSRTLTPLEAFDTQLDISGRIDVLQHPGLLYQLLDVVWLTPGHAGVEHRGLTYSAPSLGQFTSAYTGSYRDADRAMPFHVDSQDRGQLWFIDPEGTPHEIPWRGRDKTTAPMTDKLINAARSAIARREGRRCDRRSIDAELIAYLNNLTDDPNATARRQLFAADLRVTASRAEHGAAQRAAETAPLNHKESAPQVPESLSECEWPDLIGLDDIGRI